MLRLQLLIISMRCIDDGYFEKLDSHKTVTISQIETEKKQRETEPTYDHNKIMHPCRVTGNRYRAAVLDTVAMFFCVATQDHRAMILRCMLPNRHRLP